jgi:hypothetical protein
MRGAVPPLPQYAFMAWCSVKAQGQLYLLLLLYVKGMRKTTKVLSQGSRPAGRDVNLGPPKYDVAVLNTVTFGDAITQLKLMFFFLLYFITTA